jgi:hypothetical protein
MVLIRPDGYIGFSGTLADLDHLEAHLAATLL